MNISDTTRISAMEMLKKLKELLDMGAITQQEFEEKKADLMQHISFGSDKVNLGKDTINGVEDIDPKYAKDYSDKSFWDKITGVLKSAGLELIYKALQLYYVMQNSDCPLHIKTAIVAALGYFISPIDLIPDFIPVVGFTDDLAAVGAALVMAQVYVNDDVKRQAKATIDNLFGARENPACAASTTTVPSLCRVTAYLKPYARCHRAITSLSYARLSCRSRHSSASLPRPCSPLSSATASRRDTTSAYTLPRPQNVSS